MGMIYKRTWKDKDGKTHEGKTYWIKYYRAGKAYFESTKTDKKMVALGILRQREGDISKGKLPGIYFDKVLFDELAEDFLRDYRLNKKKSLVRAERSVSHLKESFEGMKANQLTTPRIQAYIEERLQDNASNATINRELSALKRMLNLGARQTPPKVDRVPYIAMLKENNTRKGFFEHGDFITLRDALPEHLRGFVTFAYKMGWRKSEITGLKWNRVDLDQGIVRLEPGESKNDEGRTVYLDDELKQVFNEQWEARKKHKTLLPYVFLNHKGTDKIKQFDKAWKKACETAKIGKRYFHDMRRTAVRNMIRAGIPERVAMMISGHKTRSIFDRYNIVSDADLKMASQKQAEYLNLQMVTNSVTVGSLQEKRVNQDVS